MYFKIEQRICGGKRPAAAEDTFNQWFLKILLSFYQILSANKRAQAHIADLRHGWQSERIKPAAVRQRVLQIYTKHFNAGQLIPHHLQESG